MVIADACQRSGSVGPAEPGFEFGEVINKMIGDPPYCLVRGVGPRWLAVDGYVDGAAVPLRPGCCQVEYVVHHAGHGIGGVPVIDLGSGISHEDIMLSRTDIPSALWAAS